MNYHDPKHPIWGVLRTAIILLTLILVLYLNASSFDETEIKTILTMFFALLGVEGISSTFSNKKAS